MTFVVEGQKAPRMATVVYYSDRVVEGQGVARVPFYRVAPQPEVVNAALAFLRTECRSDNLSLLRRLGSQFEAFRVAAQIEEYARERGVNVPHFRPVVHSQALLDHPTQRWIRVGDMVDLYREQSGLTPEQLAQQSNLHHGLVRLLDSQLIDCVTSEEGERLARTLGLKDSIGLAQERP